MKFTFVFFTDMLNLENFRYVATRPIIVTYFRTAATIWYIWLLPNGFEVFQNMIIFIFSH